MSTSLFNRIWFSLLRFMFFSKNKITELESKDHFTYLHPWSSCVSTPSTSSSPLRLWSAARLFRHLDCASCVFYSTNERCNPYNKLHHQLCSSSLIFSYTASASSTSPSPRLFKCKDSKLTYHDSHSIQDCLRCTWLRLVISFSSSILLLTILYWSLS